MRSFLNQLLKPIELSHSLTTQKQQCQSIEGLCSLLTPLKSTAFILDSPGQVPLVAGAVGVPAESDPLGESWV